MKGALSLGKQMDTKLRISTKSPSEDRIKRLLKKKDKKKNGKSYKNENNA